MRIGPHIQRRAFTVVELLVAIAVVAIIATGLSVIFGSVGDAVTEGRRVSEINRAAARIEMQIRDDLSRLSRDGFLVIANRYATDQQGLVFTADSGFPDTAPPVNGQLQGARLSPQDRTGRARRADEIMFFARGEFQTQRPTLAPGMVATAGEAAIYFGIGQKRPIDFATPNNPNNFYFNPSPRDSNLMPVRPGQVWRGTDRALLGRPEPAGAMSNPNRYAQDWSLLRQVTLLAEPQPVSVIPYEFYGRRRDRLPDRTLMLDSFRQIAMQPTARSIFNSLSWTGQPMRSGAPGTVGPDGLSRWWIGDSASSDGGPTINERSFTEWRASGVVDIAQGSILGVRREFEALVGAGLLPSRYYTPEMVNVNPTNSPALRFEQTADGFRTAWSDPSQSPSPQDARNLDLTAQQRQIRAWALDMLPSLWAGEEDPPRYLAGVRYEDLPTRMIFDSARFTDTNPGRLARTIAEANQEMLGTQIFVPRCSEFIVEWSYGFTELRPGNVRFKQLNWHGLRRADRDFNGDGRIDLIDHSTANNDQLAAFRYEERSGEPDPRRGHVVPDGPGTGHLTAPEVAVFGLATQQTYIPWPKFIRITMSLADPNDPTLERTYQFIFSVPGDQS